MQVTNKKRGTLHIFKVEVELKCIKYLPWEGEGEGEREGELQLTQTSIFEDKLGSSLRINLSNKLGVKLSIRLSMGRAKLGLCPTRT